MEKRQRYCETVSQEEKEIVWDLYFDKLYTYRKLEEYFGDKYTYAQLKAIINEKYEQHGKFQDLLERYMKWTNK